MLVRASNGSQTYTLRPVKASDLGWLTESLADYPAGFIGVAQAQHEMDYMLYHTRRFDRSLVFSDRPEDEQAIALVLVDNEVPRCIRFSAYRTGVAWVRLEATHSDYRRQGYSTAQSLIFGRLWFDELKLKEVRAEYIMEDVPSSGLVNSMRAAPPTGDDDYQRPSTRNSDQNMKGYRLTEAGWRTLAARTPTWTVSVDW